MPAGGPNNTSPAWKFYQAYEGEKIPYSRYYQRVTKGGLSFEEAILDKNMKLKGDIADHGRVCPKCQTFKEWSGYNHSRSGTSGYMTRCRDCINAYKVTYRATWAGKMRNRNYKIIQKNTNTEEYRKKNTDSHRLYVESHKEELREKHRIWLENNKERIRLYRKEYLRKLWGIGRQVEYKCIICNIFAKDPKKGILIAYLGMRIFVRKSHCKPITKTISRTDRFSGIIL